MSGFLSRLRDRLTSSSDARARLARLPFGQRIADAHAKRLFGIVAGFAQSQMLAAALELGVFDTLASGPVAEAKVRAALDLDPRGAEALIAALLAMMLVERRGDALALTIDGWVVATDPGLRAMIRHNHLLYQDLADPVAMLREPGAGRLAQFWPYRAGGGDAHGYSGLMADSLGMVADVAIDAVDFTRFDHVMDVGGGDGSFVARLAKLGEMRLTLVDLPAVIERARAKLAHEGLGDRVALHPASADGELPGGADAITLIRVLHDHDDESALRLLRGVARALPPNGRVIIAEPVAHTPPDPQAVYFAAYFAAMGSGRLRSMGEFRDLIGAAGLAIERGGTRSLLCNVMIARHQKA